MRVFFVSLVVLVVGLLLAIARWTRRYRGEDPPLTARWRNEHAYDRFGDDQWH